MPNTRVVLDTNIFVAAGFNPSSSAAQIIRAVREGRLTLVWDEATRAESRKIVEQIPPLDWEDVAGLFQPEGEYAGETYAATYSAVEDPDDRKFAALADFAGAILVSNDEHLLSVREELDLPIMTSSEFVREEL